MHAHQGWLHFICSTLMSSRSTSEITYERSDCTSPASIAASVPLLMIADQWLIEVKRSAWLNPGQKNIQNGVFICFETCIAQLTGCKGTTR
ncbi:hypothetical protein Scep_022041 [Stephania cephalantha]|uniref:Uncharacterized protein n=1 Tax=Stephania cephalantha TaxID=152367 RepID=A0AAP0FA49_9MAGN